MRIIVKGRTFESPWTGKWRCSGCRCKWTLDDTDPEPKSAFMNGYTHYYMPCPTCGRHSNRGTKEQ